jgi:phage terminase large subunit-like protein
MKALRRRLKTRKFVSLATLESKLIGPDGKPLRLFDYQRDFTEKLLFTVDKLGNRKYRRAVLSIARKNGKTCSWASWPCTRRCTALRSTERSSSRQATGIRRASPGIPWSP